MSNESPAILSGRCYCGAIEFITAQKPQSVVYCHCDSCRRASGAPVAAFAGLDEDKVSFIPNEGREISVNPGATRTFCSNCGSSLVGRYEYLPGKIFISLGVVDQAKDLVPELHCHESERLPWLQISDGLQRMTASGRAKLNEESK